MRARVHIVLREILAGKPAVNRYCTVCDLLHEDAWADDARLVRHQILPALSAITFKHLMVAGNNDFKLVAVTAHAAAMMLETLDIEEQEYLLHRLESLYVKTEQA